MKTQARYAAAALLSVLCAGPAVAEDGGEALFAKPEEKEAVQDTAPACKPEFVVQEPDTEGMDGIYDARWCGPGAIVYMTSTRYAREEKRDPYRVWVDLETGEHRRIASGRVIVNYVDNINAAAASFGCDADGGWAYFVIPEDYPKRSTEILAWSVANGQTTSFETKGELRGAVLSPDGRMLLLSEYNRPGVPAGNIVMEKLTQPPFWDLLRLHGPRSPEPAWLPNSKSFRFSLGSAGDFIVDLGDAGPVTTRLNDVSSATDVQVGGRTRDDYLVGEWNPNPQHRETTFRNCRIAGNRRHCNDIATMPHWGEEGASDFVARHGEKSFFYGTWYVDHTGEDQTPAAVYRYDLATGQSFRIAKGRLFPGLSPDGRRLIYRSEPFTLNVLNLDDPATRSCGEPVAAGKK